MHRAETNPLRNLQGRTCKGNSVRNTSRNNYYNKRFFRSQPITSNVINDNKKNTDICNTSDKEVLTGSSSNSIDLRQRNVPAYEKIFPEFYHSTFIYKFIS